MDELINTSQNITPPIQENKLTAFFKKNRYIIFAFTGLLGLISIFIFLIIASSNTQSTTIKPTPSTAAKPTITIKPTSTQTTVIPTIAITPGYVTQEEKALIEQQTETQLDERIGIRFTISRIKTFTSNWAIMQVTNPDTDPANVVIKKENDSWRVVAGPGTYFEEADLRAIGAPESLIKEANQNI